MTARYHWTTLALSDVKRVNGGTINDSILAAYILALSETRDKPCLVEIHITIDLRRYLDEKTAPLACNLSGMASVCLTVDKQDTFQYVIAQVQSQTALLKSGSVGLESFATTTYLRTLPYQKAKAALIEAGKNSRASGVAAPILSNLGQIARDTISFGDCAVTGITPLLPAMRAPAFILGASGYNDTLTLCAGYYPEERAPDDIMSLLDSIHQILEK